MASLWQRIKNLLGIDKQETEIAKQIGINMESSKAILKEIKETKAVVSNTVEKINKDVVQQAAERVAKQTLETAKEAAIQQSIDAIKKISKS
jgi:hypothetical protein